MSWAWLRHKLEWAEVRIGPSLKALSFTKRLRTMT